MNAAIQSDDRGADWLAVVKDHVESLRFGTVQITVHDSRVVQIEKTEKIRFDKAGPDASVRPNPR